MKAQNAKQRNDLFFQWFLIFILAVGVVAIALFFDYEFQGSDYDRLQSENNILRPEVDKTKGSNTEYEVNIIGVLINEIKSHGMPGSSQSVITNHVNQGTTKLSNINSGGSSRKLDSLIAICLNNWNDDKIALTKSNSDFSDVKQKLQDCSTDRDNYKKDLADCKIMTGGK